MTSAADTDRLKVFISYSRKDGAFAEDLLLALEAAGFDPYLDKHDIVPGEPWEERLDRLIQAADTVVFIISPDSIKSERVEWEINRTEDLGKRIIPVVWREVAEADTPVRLRRLNYVFFSGEGRSFGRGLFELAKALNTDLEWIRAHTTYSEQAVRWKSKGQPESLLLRGDAIGEAKAWMVRRPNNAPEPTLVQREYIGESEKAEQARVAFEKAQAEAMKNAELDKLRAEQESDKLRLEVLERRQKQSRLLFAALAVFIALGGGFAWREYQNRLVAEALVKSEKEREELQAQLAALTQTAALENKSPGVFAGYVPGKDDGGPVKGPATPPQGPRDLPAEIPSSGEVRQLISKDAIDLMIAFEVGSRSQYEQRFGKPIYPGGASGVVIGFGYDLGYNTDAEFRSDWGKHLSPEVLERLAATVGKRQQAAIDALPSVSDIVIPWDAASDVFLTTTLVRYGALVIKTFPNARELPPDAFGALVSLVYNRGASLTGEKRKEMLAIRDLMAERRFAEIPAQLRAMKQLWPTMPALQNRREAEALLFEKGLLDAGRTAVRKS